MTRVLSGAVLAPLRWRGGFAPPWLFLAFGVLIAALGVNDWWCSRAPASSTSRSLPVLAATLLTRWWWVRRRATRSMWP